MESVGRRNLIEWAIRGLAALIAAGLGVPAIAYLFTPGKARGKSGWIDVADLEKLQPRVPEEVVFRRVRVDGWKIISEKSTAWVVKLSGKEVAVFTPQCTHLGCAYNFDSGRGQFICPCHTSYFSIDGRVLSGPAPRPLDQYAVRIEGARVMIRDEDVS
jgi:menaquinol-cytochrome c reductase iron-sulfur subunit